MTERATTHVDGEAVVLAEIAKFPEAYRALGERLHEVVTKAAPSLEPKLWYGMPAYAKDGKVICFFRPGERRAATGRAPSVGAMRYATFGFYETANLDDGELWPVAFALTSLTQAVERQITALVQKAVR